MKTVRTPREVFEEIETVRATYKAEGWGLGPRERELTIKLDALQVELDITRRLSWKKDREQDQFFGNAVTGLYR